MREIAGAKSYCDLIDFSIELNEEARNFYISRYKKVGRTDIKGLILSLVEQNKEYIKDLMEIKQQGNVEKFFDNDIDSLRKADFSVNSGKISQGDYLDYLQGIIGWLEIFLKINTLLAEHSNTDDMKLRFKQFSEEYSKQKQIFSDRYELEQIKKG